MMKKYILILLLSLSIVYSKPSWEERTKDREMILNYQDYKEELKHKYPDKQHCEIIFIIIKKYVANELKFNYGDRGIYNSDRDYCIKHEEIRNLKKKNQEYEEIEQKKKRIIKDKENYAR